jgi:hypothetical protein
VYAGSTDYHSLVLLSLPSFYYCQTLNFTNVEGVDSIALSICYVLAEEERTLRTLNLSPQEIQGNVTQWNLSIVEPLYSGLSL